MSAAVRSARHDDVAVIEIDNPPVNALGAGVPEALTEAIDRANADAAVVAIVIRGAGRTFIAGADIALLEQAAWGDESAAAGLAPLLRSIEDSPKPVVMAIHGTALGGGLEIAMAGHYRVATSDALLGQPEVNLGIIPGAEGTQRLPRLVGVAKALEMCVTGRPVSSEDAAANGLVDEIAHGDLTATAVAAARRLASNGRPVKTRDRAERLGTPAANAPLFASARQLAAKVKRRQTAPVRAVEAIEAATTLTFEEGARREREIFFECVRGEQARSLIHVFFAERAAARPTFAKATAGGPTFAKATAGGDLRNAPACAIQSVAVIGAGTMGAGIAMACANAGLAVHLSDTAEGPLESGLRTIRHNYATSVERGRLTSAAAEQRLARITSSAAFDGAAHADLVIEAVFEDMAVKQQVFRELDRVARADAVLATNTSTLDIDRLAGVTSRPASVLGLHFFSPAHVMRLLEIVRGTATGGDVLATALALARQLKKQPVVVGNGPGFVGNRLFFPYIYEMQFLVEEGATPAQVDRALTDFGMAMGVFAVDDLAGLDVGWRVKQALGHFSDGRGRAPLVHDHLIAMERFGQKRGKGWYRYDEARTPTPDPEVEALIRTLAADAGIPQRTIADAEIVDRAILALVNEGARALALGLAARASDIDVIYTSGYGFPSWRGGPMFYADRLGLAAVVDRIAGFQRDHGDRWEPAPLLVELARSGRTFRDWDRARVPPQ